MPIHDLGYRSWEGERSSNMLRWWVIAQTGIHLVWKNSALKRMLFFSWMPVIVFAGMIFFYEQALKQSPESLNFVVVMLKEFDTSKGGEFNELIHELRTDPEKARHQVWATILLILFRAPQAVLMVMMVSIIAPSLISRDMRSRAFLLYFSRPITPKEYVLGKSLIVWAYLTMITGVPALMLYGLAVLLSPDLGVVLATWDLPFRIILATAVLAIPTTAMALCFSSMTMESRYAAFGWYAVWVLGWVTYSMIVNIQKTPPEYWRLVSPYHTLGQVQGWVFGVGGDFNQVAAEATMILVVTTVALFILMRRVAAPMKI